MEPNGMAAKVIAEGIATGIPAVTEVTVRAGIAGITPAAPAEGADRIRRYPGPSIRGNAPLPRGIVNRIVQLNRSHRSKQK